tara:strand:+ start:1653 stop:2033 length:381 start_codon:yes stop_codon:yes gene_type:complete
MYPIGDNSHTEIAINQYLKLILSLFWCIMTASNIRGKIMKRSTLISQLRALHNQATSSSVECVVGVVGAFDTQYEFDISRFADRQHLISELQHALHIAEDPKEDFAEFDLLDTSFCLDFEKDTHHV